MKTTIFSVVCALVSALPVHAAQIYVAPGGSIAQAVARAVPGDEIVLEAGAVYTEYFTLPDKGAGAPITIRSSAVLPDRRISPGDRALLPSLGSGVGMAPIIITGSNWHIVGIAFRANTNGDGNIIDVQGQAENILIDRILIEGGANGQKRGVAMNGGGAITVTRSYFWNLWKLGQESQGLAAWNGPGPFTIRDNYIEAATENILFGGADSSSDARMPADILVEGNHLTKNPEWQGTSGKAIKNLFELKAARRATIRNNLMEHNWVDGQSGWAIVFTPRNQDGRAPWTVLEDVLFEGNIVRHTVGGVNISGRDDLNQSGQTRRVTFRNNLFVTDATWIQAGGEIGELTLDHNTVVNGSTLIKMYVSTVHEGTYMRPAEFAIGQLTILNSLMQHGVNGYGIWGEASGSGVIGLNYHTLGYDLRRNVIAGENGANVIYPPDTLQPTYAAHDANFVGADHLLVADSSYKAAALDGNDLGRLPNGGSGGTPPQVPNAAPTVELTAPANASTFRAPVTIRLAAIASDSDGVVARVSFYAGPTLVGSDVSEPFEVGWTAAPGSYVITAKVFDNLGAMATSPRISITVQPAAPLPSPWTAQDIGAVAYAGSAGVSSGLWTLHASGADVWGDADAFHYAWQRVSGDVDVIARVASVDNVHAWTKAGVMIRETLAADSPQAFMLASPGKGLAFQRRLAAPGISTHTTGGMGTAPVWVKLERRTNNIYAYYSADGAAWTLVGSDTFTMGADVYVGLALTSHDNAKIASATFDNVRVNLAAPPEPDPDPVVPVLIATQSLPAGRATVAYSSTLSASGGAGSYTWSVATGTLPAGVTLDGASGLISGTPQAAGTFTFTARAADAADASNAGNQALTITVAAPVSVATNNLPNVQRRKTYSATLNAANAAGTVTWQLQSGALPAGLTLNGSTGVISGSTTVNRPGTFMFTVAVTDSNTRATKALSIAVK